VTRLTDSLPIDTPDWQQLVFDALNDLARHNDPQVPPEAQIVPASSPELIVIRCQRVWRAVTTTNPVLNGGDFGACVAQYEYDDRLYGFFIMAARQASETIWRPSGMSGGPRPSAHRDHIGGFHLGAGSFVCVGGIGAVPNGGLIEVELPDGSIHLDRCTDGCAIVFAPAVASPEPGATVTVRYRAADGSQIAADTAPFGYHASPRP
jgi:hypothetical protein